MEHSARWMVFVATFALEQCVEGRVFSLAQVEAEDGKDEDGVSPIASIWRIEEPKDLANGTQLQKTLFAIRFKGRITCEAESCGEVLVVLVNGEGRESICSSIDTDLISVLDGYTIQCSNAVTGSDAVAIKLVPSAKVSTVPKLQLYNGHARFILTPKEEPRSVSTQSIPPEESFGWSFAPSFTASPVVGHSYFTTESSNDQLKNFGLSTKSSHQSGESVDASFEIVLSTTIEEKSSIPFQSTEFGDDSTSDAAVPFKFDRTQMAAESMVPDATVSGADEDFSQLSVSIASTQPTLNQVQPPNPLQNDAEVLSQEVQDVPKEAKANGTVLDLLTAGSGSLSITNLVMIIVIVSIVTIVATAGLAWFFCAHDK